MKALSLALAAFLVAAPSRAGDKLVGSALSIPRNAATGGGELLTGAGLSLNTAVAEAAVSSFTGAGLRLYSGLMNVIAQPGSVTSIVAVSKTTGTLALSWSAPGLDGFVGGVTGGHYRIDASSDPLHVFAPTQFLTEFSTDVVPGQAESYTLKSLEPNTTYYTRIYLSDDRKVVAETSSRSDESTWANLPADPVISAAACGAVRLTWDIPAGGAEGYQIAASSTNYGQAAPGGQIVSSSTKDGTAVTLTIVGLEEDATYYFRLGSFNWQSQQNFATLLSTWMPAGSLFPIQNLVLTPDARRRTVGLNWENPANLICPDSAGVLVMVSTQPIGNNIVGGTPYDPGTVFADSSVLKSTTAGTSYLASGVDLDTTHYFRLYNSNNNHAYSIHVATYIVLDLPPMAPAGLQGFLTADRTSMTMSWAGVSSNLDGSSFKLAAAPTSWELERYNVYRATGVVRSNWVLVGSAPVNSGMFTAAIPDPNSVYYYKVAALDAFKGDVDDAMVVDTLGNLYAVGRDMVSRLKIPPSVSGALQPDGNTTGRPLLVRAEERPEDVGGRIVTSLAFRSVSAPGNEPVAHFQFSAPDAESILHYDVAGGRVVASLGSQSVPLLPSISASDAPRQLGTYWFNGQEYVKLYGRVDPLDQTVSVRTAMAGGYQVRSLIREAGVTFDVSNITNKAITPNGDGLNDTVIFSFDNQMDMDVSGKIFDVRGAFVSSMSQSPVHQSRSGLMWDGKSNGQAVPRGVYIYQIKGGDKTFSGTILVIR